ncbi:MAG: HPF/RaiA family ribosome-associated protein [Deltaproteobacteria bacterium]|nr:HPF/RaiA family ribosome-associated protein [Deltaproteobacteria bacterium]
MKTRKIILRQGQSPGDILTMSRAVADLKLTFPSWQIDVRTPCPAIWENNPHLTRLSRTDSSVEEVDVRYDEINQSGWRGHHFTDAFRHDIEKKLGVKIKKTGIKPEIYLSEEEKSWVNQVEVEFGWKGAFWLINAGYKPDNELKFYPRWQEVVDAFNEYFKGAIRLVQVGHVNHRHPRLKGVYDLVGRTDLRQLIRLAWWAHGTIGPLSFQFVLSAAYEQPHVVVAAGKEGVRWHIYPHGRYLYTNGALNCCLWDGCWKGGEKGKCVDLVPGSGPRCFELIRPYMIVDAVKMYYEGGRLDLTRGK